MPKSRTTLPLNEKISVAQDKLENYNFGDDISVECHGTWEWDTNDEKDFVNILFVSYSDDDDDEPTHRISFHVNFDDNDFVEDFYALDIETGNEIGYQEKIVKTNREFLEALDKLSIEELNVLNLDIASRLKPIIDNVSTQESEDLIVLISISSRLLEGMNKISKEVGK